MRSFESCGCLGRKKFNRRARRREVMSLYPAWPPDSICQAINSPQHLPFDRQQINALHVILQIFNLISLLANAFTIATYLLFKRTFPKSMPIFFALASSGLHLFLLIGAFAGPESLCASVALCKVQGTSIIMLIYRIGAGRIGSGGFRNFLFFVAPTTKSMEAY